MCSLPLKMLKNVVVLTWQHYLLKPKNQDTLTFCAPRIDVKCFFNFNQKSKVGASQFQKMGEFIRFQSWKYELHKYDQRKQLQ